MQKVLSVLLVSVFLSAFALADTAQAQLTLVRKSRHHAAKSPHHVTHHHAHKATKHHAPKRHSHSV